MVTALLKLIVRPKWVAFSSNDTPSEIELGLLVWGRVISLYKGEVLVYEPNNLLDVRAPEKREFGESLYPQ